MKNILMLAHADRGQEARLQVALAVTRALHGHLTVLDVTVVPEVVTDYVAMGGSALSLADEERSEQSNRAHLQARLERENVSFDLIEATGDLPTCLHDASGLTDLVVVNRELDHALYPNMLDLVGKLVVEAKLPVLAVPDDVEGLKLGGHALVAWDGSPSADTALRAAVPLLKLAGTVTLLYVDDGSLRLPLDDAVRYLARHDIKATVRREQVLLDPAGIVILAEASSGSVDYVVMGGFGHARLLESIFGGVTERMLTDSPVPVFLAHRP